MELVTHRLLQLHELPLIRAHFRAQGKIVVATSGCFDLLHSGHIQLLEDAKSLGDVLIIGLNSDSSTRRVKGPGRPLLPQDERALMLGGLRAVDHVVIFDELTPHRFLELLKPDIYCKASDYTLAALPERDVILANGGVIRLLTLKPGVSTSFLVSRILASWREGELPLSPGTQGPSAGWQEALEYLLANANHVRQSAYLFAEMIEQIAQRIATATPDSNVFVYGDEGSEADASSIANELADMLSGKHIALTITSIAAAHDHAASNAGDGRLHVAEGQKTLGSSNGFLVVLSPKEGSARAADLVRIARNNGLCVIALTGPNPTTLSELVDFCLRVPAPDTLTVRQIHLYLLQALGQRLLELGKVLMDSAGIVT